MILRATLAANGRAAAGELAVDGEVRERVAAVRDNLGVADVPGGGGSRSGVVAAADDVVRDDSGFAYEGMTAVALRSAMVDGVPRADNGRAYAGEAAAASRCGEGDVMLRDSGFEYAGDCSAGDAALRASLRGVIVVAAAAGGCEGEAEDATPREVGLA